MKKWSVIFLIGAGCLLAVFAQEAKKIEPSNSNLRVTQIAGKHLFTLKNCGDCHTLASQAEGKLTPVTNKRDDHWFAAHVEEESKVVLREAKTDRIRRRVLQDEILALDDYLYKSKSEDKKQIDAMTENVFQGAYLVYQNNCLNCHAVAGSGKDIGPELSKIGSEHDKKWLIANFKNPQQFAAESVMPKFDTLPEETLAKMADYLLTLRK
jgi:mono/diheme cytochrome c family protein